MIENAEYSRSAAGRRGNVVGAWGEGCYDYIGDEGNKLGPHSPSSRGVMMPHYRVKRRSATIRRGAPYQPVYIESTILPRIDVNLRFPVFQHYINLRFLPFVALKTHVIAILRVCYPGVPYGRIDHYYETSWISTLLPGIRKLRFR